VPKMSRGVSEKLEAREERPQGVQISIFNICDSADAEGLRVES